MSEYIESEKLIKKFCNHCLANREEVCTEDCFDLKIIKSIPSADFQPAVHGRWINTMPNVEYKSFCQVKCSICESIEAYGNFCRNCGADMRGE